MARRGDRIEIDLDGAGEARRWRIELELRNASLPFRWRDDRLITSAAAGDRLTWLGLLDFTEPDADQPERHRLAPQAAPYAAPPVRIVATQARWSYANPFATWKAVAGVITIGVAFVALLQYLLS